MYEFIVTHYNSRTGLLKHRTVTQDTLAKATELADRTKFADETLVGVRRNDPEMFLDLPYIAPPNRHNY